MLSHNFYFRIMILLTSLIFCTKSIGQDIDTWHEPDTFYNLKKNRIELILESGNDGRALSFNYYKNNNIKSIDYVYYINEIEYTQFTEYRPNQIKSREYTVASKKRAIIAIPYLDGSFSTYNDKGNIVQSSEYKHNKLNGETKKYYDDGALKSTELYASNKLNGVSKTYFQNGKLASELIYVNNLIKSARFYSEEGLEYENNEFKDGNGKLNMYEFGFPSGKCIVKNGKLKKCSCD